MLATSAPPANATPNADPLEKNFRTQLRDIGIPPRPTILEQIDREMRKEEPDFRHLEQLISADVGLAAGLIKTANSPAFAFGRKVRSVHDALLVLGLKAVVRTLAGLSLQNIFPNTPNLERFWDASATTARISAWLALQLRKHSQARPDDAYTFALFRDCGIPMLMIPFPEYLNILKAANSERERSFTSVEDELLAINHALVGAELAENWLLPEDIHAAIRHHHEAAVFSEDNPLALAEVSRDMIAVTQLAEHLLQQISGLNQTCEWEKLGESCCARLQLTADEIDELATACASMLREEA